MDEAELEELAQDIREHGLREPITLHPNDQILDGRNRYRACLRAGVPPRFVTWKDDGAPTSFVISLNLKRRQLTTSQRAMIAAAAKPLLQEEARQRQAHGLTAPHRTLSVTSREAFKAVGKSSVLAGAAVGVGGSSVESASVVLAQGVPELVSAVRSGNVTVTRAKTIARLPRGLQRQALTPSSRMKALPKQAAVDIFRRSVQALHGICLGLARCDVADVLRDSDGKALRDSLREAITLLRRIYAGMGGNGGTQKGQE
jgi:hypothetical protein